MNKSIVIDDNKQISIAEVKPKKEGKIPISL